MAREGELEISEVAPADQPRVRDITLQAYAEYAAVMAPAAWSGLERAMHRVLDDGAGAATRLVARRDGEIVGTVLLFPAAVRAYGHAMGELPWPEVRLLAVAPEARRTGVARALMDECVRRARATGAHALGIHTSRSMRGAMALYRGMGFERVPAHDFQPPGAELVEAYRLPLD